MTDGVLKRDTDTQGEGHVAVDAETSDTASSQGTLRVERDPQKLEEAGSILSSGLRREQGAAEP